jgi:hypothetical protein
MLLASLALTAQREPISIDIPQGARLLLKAKGDGVQIYTCTDGKWTLKAPDAKLLDNSGKVIGSHFAGPTWRLNDGSEIKGKVVGNQPSPDASSVAWLLLQTTSNNGTGTLADAAYIRRTDTHGGAAPKEACTNGETRVPYTATYTFYAK